MSDEFYKGLPIAGAPGKILGFDAADNPYLLTWDARPYPGGHGGSQGCWIGMGFDPRRPNTPLGFAAVGDKADFIVRWAPLEGRESTFQPRVHAWMLACFGAEIAADRMERNHRFLEEALELVQALGCSRFEAHQLVDYVFDRPVGDPPQEAGGVMVTLAALLNAAGIDLGDAAETELARVWTKVEAIRAKQAAKPKHSPLPEAVNADPV